jgi:hypothetical protein
MFALGVRNLEVAVRTDHLSCFEDSYGFRLSLHPILDSYLEVNDYCFLPNPYLLTIHASSHLILQRVGFIFEVKTDLNNYIPVFVS